MNIAYTQKGKPEPEDWQYINDIKTTIIVPTNDLTKCIIAIEDKNDDGKPYVLLSSPGATIKITGLIKMEVICRR